MNNNNYIFVMAGGIGSRFWPKSRNNFPKQFIDILGIGKSLLQLTYSRFLQLVPSSHIYIVTNTRYKSLVAQQLPEVSQENILCEPSRNNTAPSIAYATFKLAAANPVANMIVAPSDHFILYEDIFLERVKQGLDAVTKRDILLTLGIQPTRPDTGYGYIRYEKKDENGINKVNQFTEKPSLERAVEFLETGEYLWNGGIFIWSVKSGLNAFRQHANELYQLFEQGEKYYNTPEEQTFIDAQYSLSQNISIDYAIMEKANNVYTLPVDFGWSDLGTWNSLYEIADKNHAGNVVSGGAPQLQQTENCIIHLPTGKLAVIKGLRDFIVVDDNNVLLIYPKHEEQEIKKVTENLKNLDLTGFL